jgi:hypothetical protein
VGVKALSIVDCRLPIERIWVSAVQVGTQLPPKFLVLLLSRLSIGNRQSKITYG